MTDLRFVTARGRDGDDGDAAGAAVSETFSSTVCTAAGFVFSSSSLGAASLPAFLLSFRDFARSRVLAFN